MNEGISRLINGMVTKESMTYGWDDGIGASTRAGVAFFLWATSRWIFPVGCHSQECVVETNSVSYFVGHSLGRMINTSKNQKTNTSSSTIVAHSRSTWQGGEQNNNTIVLRVAGEVRGSGRVAEKILEAVHLT